LIEGHRKRIVEDMADQKSKLLGFTQLYAGIQFFLRLPRYLRHPMTLAEARMSLSNRLRTRDESFLEKVKLDIFGHPESPYFRLFQYAGCEYGDIESGVLKDGIELTLQRLFQAGVYLSIDEFKGRKKVRRGQLELQIGPEMLRAPRASYHLPASSCGSRGAGTPVMIDLAFIRSCAGNAAISLSARGEFDWRKSDWESPGAGLRFRVIKYAGFSDLPTTSFSQIDPDSSDIASYFKWNLRLMHCASLLAGRPLPRPKFAPLSDPSSIASWLQDTILSGATPHLFTFPGSAVVLSRWAIDNDFDISGSWMTISGEPITRARVATIEAAGCHVIPRYGTMEAGAIGYGCTLRDHPDDLHFISDMHALIQAGDDGELMGLPSKALLLTSLHPQAPFVMLNLSMGDQADIADRSCGCPLERLGWTKHIWDIRSFEKLTGESVTFEGTDVIPVLEEILPTRFGGTPADYQLAESELADGAPVLKLLVHPRLGDLDEQAVANEFLSALSRRSTSDAMMIRRWRDAGTLVVERSPPLITKSGKINYFHT